MKYVKAATASRAAYTHMEKSPKKLSAQAAESAREREIECRRVRERARLIRWW